MQPLDIHVVVCVLKYMLVLGNMSARYNYRQKTYSDETSSGFKEQLCQKTVLFSEEKIPS